MFYGLEMNYFHIMIVILKVCVCWELIYYAYCIFYKYVKLDKRLYIPDRIIHPETFEQMKQYYKNEKNLNKYFTDSFVGVTDVSKVSHNQVYSLLHYHIYNQDTSTIESSKKIEELIEIIENNMNIKFSNDDIYDTSVNKHVMSAPLKVFHKPYFIYFLFSIFRFLFNLFLQYILGFHRVIDHKTKVTLWIYLKHDSELSPLIFVHGIGSGELK